MKTLFVICKNHLDLTWRRCFEGYFEHEGYVIRPYAEIEEHLLDFWLDRMERDGVSYDIEQTATIRMYLSRNPDAEPRVRALVQAGKLSFLGGGESVIDYNLPDGESIVRNHLYSRRYLKRVFDFTPRFAACPDTFGLSAQLPQLFRQLGYPCLTEFARVFENNKPVWQGISGHRVALDTVRVVDIGQGDFVKYPACSACMGEGCCACRYTGIDIEYRSNMRDGARAAFEARLSQTLAAARGDVVLSLGNEEVLEPEDFARRFERIAREHGFGISFVGLERRIADAKRPLIEAVLEDRVPESDIDPRPEGNPVASGCYISRIRIKQENRRMEAYLMAAERLSALAHPRGLAYPARAIERLYHRLALYQFHDALPASHSDAAYDELLNVAREVRADAGRMMTAAAMRIAADIEVPDGEGLPFAVFNPLGFAVTNARLTGVVRLPQDASDAPGAPGYILDAAGARHEIEACERADNYGDVSLTVRFTADLPALGYQVFRFIEGEAAPLSDVAPDRIENRRFLIKLGRRGIVSVYDKQLGREIARDGVCSPYLEEDAGHLWGRLGLRGYAECADRPFSVDFMTPSRKHSVRVRTCAIPGGQRAHIDIRYDRHEERLEDLDWRMTVTLRDGADEIDFHIDVLWDAADLRLMARFPLTFTTPGDAATYEIPFGQLSRGRAAAFNEHLGHSNDWPALRYVCAHDAGNDYTVALYNAGTPAHRFLGGELFVGLLRSPTRLLCGYDTDRAREREWRSFDFALTAYAGAVHAGQPARGGWALNALFPAFALKPQRGTLPACASLLALPDRAQLSCLKVAEDGGALVARYYEPYGEDVRFDFAHAVRRWDILEAGEPGEARETHALAPFEIATFEVPMERFLR